MQTQDFLVEIGTEELPPKALKNLSDAFSQQILQGLKDAGLSHGPSQSFASPRRLALRVEQLSDRQADKTVEKRGPAKKAAYDDNGEPTRALTGFASSLGIKPEDLDEVETPKGTWLVYRTTETGKQTVELLNAIVESALAKLPIPKRMRWGAQKEEFVRPVQWIVMMMGSDAIPGSVLGIHNGTSTRGHRFMSTGALHVDSPSNYENILKDQGKVLADYQARKELIREGVTAIAEQVNGQAVIDEALLDEVASLNEWPVPLLGNFEERFLDVPAEALVSSMKEHQKYFHVVNKDGKMLPHFITVANIESKDPGQVISGNERVIRPRLSDAAFFFETDKKTTLESKREALKSIVFQSKLGTIYDKTVRVAELSERISSRISGQPAMARRAAELAKSDLVSEMVLEFTDLQGLMGYHYALHDGEEQEVARAINEQYMPTHAGAELPGTVTGCALAIAEKVDSLVGLFGINQPPTGTKDPFALRRAALGVLRIIIEKELDLDLLDLFSWSRQCHCELENDNLETELLEYMLERFRAWYQDEGIPAEVIHAVSARKPSKPLDFDRRIKAVHNFYQRPEASALSAANKRVSNILAKQASFNDDNDLEIDSSLLTEAAEQELAKRLSSLESEVEPLFEAGRYQEALAALAQLQQPVDTFFDDVMVMVEDEAIRNNRIILLGKLRRLFLKAADISLLST